MLTYEETMRLGTANYAKPINALRGAGWQAEFTQTGGMNAVIEITLEGGCTLSITDADDSLSWCREYQQGWGVGFCADGDRFDCLQFDGVLAYESDDATDTQTLLELVWSVVREGKKELVWRQQQARRAT